MANFIIQLQRWGWLIAVAIIILILLSGKNAGCAKQEQSEPLDLFQSAAEDLNSAYRKQERAERSRARYHDGVQRFIGAQESEGLWGNDRRTTSPYQQPSKEERGNNCCDSAGVTVGNGNQIVNVHVGDGDEIKKDKSVVEARQTQTSSSKSSSTPYPKKRKNPAVGSRSVVHEKQTIINNYYRCDDERTTSSPTSSRSNNSESLSLPSFRKEVETSQGTRVFTSESEYNKWLNNFKSSGGNPDDCIEMKTISKPGDFYKEISFMEGTRVFRGEKGRKDYEKYLKDSSGFSTTSATSSSSSDSSSTAGFRKEVETSQGTRVFTSESEYNAWMKNFRRR